MKLNIAHLYPDFLNLYGDTGNITSLKKRCLWRNVEVNVKEYALDDEIDFENTDIIYIGGGTDKSQKIVNERLMKMSNDIKEHAENNGVILGVCSGFEILGNYFMIGDEKIPALNIIDFHTEYSQKRIIGDIVIKCNFLDKPVVGFENHNGRVCLGANAPLGTVIYGNGNNNSDKNEGVIYKNVFGTYIHGPLLPKNPHLCDEIIKRALTRKYDLTELMPLDDAVEFEANDYIYNRFCKDN